MRRIETFKKIKKLLDNPRTTAEDLAEVVVKDQALAGSLYTFHQVFWVSSGSLYIIRGDQVAGL